MQADFSAGADLTSDWTPTGSQSGYVGPLNSETLHGEKLLTDS